MKFNNKLNRYISNWLAASVFSLYSNSAFSSNIEYKPRGIKDHVSISDEKKVNLGNPLDPPIVPWPNMHFYPLQADTTYSSVDTTSVNPINLQPIKPSIDKRAALEDKLYIAHDNPLYTARHDQTLMTPLYFGRNINPDDVLDINNYKLLIKNANGYDVIACADTVKLDEKGIKVGIREVNRPSDLLARIAQYYNNNGNKQMARNFGSLAIDVSKNPNLRGFVVWANDKDNKYCQSLPFLADLSLEERAAQPETLFVEAKPETVTVEEYQIRPEAKEAVIPNIKTSSKKKWAILGGVVGGVIVGAICHSSKDHDKKQHKPKGWGHDRDDPHDGVGN